ncbi:MAG: DUF4215 domain-containing protein [Sandaracinaceae bacterium]|nr:DUF4215 domain-containing protein [Sandaracinaceae bacterium]
MTLHRIALLVIALVLLVPGCDRDAPASIAAIAAPSRFDCVASCVRPNGDTHDVAWQECVLDARLAEENAGAQCAAWRSDAVVNAFAFCEPAHPAACGSCGDGAVELPEACDDGNSDSGDGCSSSCEIEAGFRCGGAPSRCFPIVRFDCEVDCIRGNGDFLSVAWQPCDVDARLAVERAPGVCASWRPDAVVQGDPRCAPSASPSCAWECGDGRLDGPETCDDTNVVPGDGCSSSCALEPGFSCSGTPSVCAPLSRFACTTSCIRPNGDTAEPSWIACETDVRTAEEQALARCQDWAPDAEVNNVVSCAPTVPPSCAIACGDGRVDEPEACDDGNALSGDGCSSVCGSELGFVCAGAPSVCAPLSRFACTTSCIRPNGDTAEPAWTSCEVDVRSAQEQALARCRAWAPDAEVNNFVSCERAVPSECSSRCGDGTPTLPETCDDGNVTPGDGCSADCAAENGYLCSGAPSQCAVICGDARVVGAEACDDGNCDAADGCDHCRVEPGFACAGSPSVCTPL